MWFPFMPTTAWPQATPPHAPGTNPHLSSRERQLAVRPLPSPDLRPMGPEEACAPHSWGLPVLRALCHPTCGGEELSGVPEKSCSSWLGVAMLSNGLLWALF